MERMTSDYKMERAFWGEYTRKSDQKKIEN